MKKTTFIFPKPLVVAILLAGILFGVFYWNQNQSRRTRPTKTGQKDEQVVTVDPLVEEWNSVKAGDKFQKCLQSQQGMAKLVGDLEPEYRKTVSKEAEGIGLTKQDRYIRYIYSLWRARARDYSIFDSFNNAIPPKDNFDSMRNLLDYIYCPDMSNVSSKYPASVGSCQEATQAWMNPFEIPMPQNFKFPEEYDLAKKKFKEGLTRSANNAKSCCSSPGDTSSPGICLNLKEFMK